jgi:glucose-1-phosphate adenylyltransferase
VDWAAIDRPLENVEPDSLFASMGIYVFKREVLDAALAGPEADFGKHVIPALVNSHRTFAYLYQGYWEDVGTIRSFYDANLDLCEPLPKFNFYDAMAPIFTHARYLPPSKIIRGRLDRTVISDGCVINDAVIEHSLIGLRAESRPGHPRLLIMDRIITRLSSAAGPPARP